MGKYFKFGSEVEPLKFNNQHEALKRYLFTLLIFFILLLDAITVNLVSYFILNKTFQLYNKHYSNWFTATTFVSMGLLILAFILRLLPSIPRSKEKNEDLLLQRDFIKISQELFKPTERRYKVIGILLSVSRLLGIAVFLANLVLIFVGIFSYYI